MVQPFVRELFADVEKSDAFRRVLLPLKRGTSAAPGPGTGGTKAGAGRTRVSGLTPAAKALHLPLLRRGAQRPLLVIVRDNRAADAQLPVLRAACELTGAADPDATIALPAYDVLPFENQSPHPEIQEERAAALWKIATGAAEIVVAPIESALMRMRPAEHYSGLARTLRKGESLDSERLVEHLNLVGYVKVDVVEMPGQYAVRGGILDVYSPEMDRPARAEFFGDEIESLRKFDPASQRSQNPLDEAVLLPLTETAVSEETLAAIHTRLSGRRITGAEATVEEAVVAAGVSVFPGWELYAPVAGASATLLDLLPEAAVFVDEPGEVARELEAFWERLEAAHEQSGVGKLVRPEELFLSPDEWQAALAPRAGGSLEHLGIETADTATITLASQPTPKFHGAVPALVEEVQRLTAEGRRVLFCAGSTGELERLADIFTEYSVPFRLGMRTGTAGGESFLDEAAYFTEDVFATTLVRAYVPDGVLLPASRLAVFGSRDLFDESEASVSRPIKQKSKTAAFMSDFRDLAVGDYVVHVEHGIGQYCGLREIEQEGAKAEFMVLEYAEAAKLYVPLTRLDLIQKYRSAEGAKPVLSRLGTAAWQKTKTRVKKAMKEMADELLRLYAARKTAEGHKFPADTDWQREFEDAFEFQETEDQTAAVADIKADMQSQQPMDRLLCGDVGYGKTEVAMRAAFKAVSDGKQVAVLAPTTVLAFQHFETFKERFKQFPLTIEMISRFRTPKQQKAIVEKVEQGKVDVLIGTHRLLSKDIKFQDLGLLVVDEEQRFGVRHKERLKQMKREVDVLTMSATPIPRTLHMAVVGLRDMSVIETPPKDRIAIQTVVAAFDEKLIKSALEQEIERGGQVYFVHNRVESIYEIAAKIKDLVPKARVLVGHGQMSETELESVMLGFIRHEADVLVATTIIENGLDIPLCNTILINRADRHGLSELYQLRGRVGRSNRRAYAYLLVPPEQELTAIARRRLAALKEFSDLGAGFKIAALDLELRGAGNLLGGEQSGHIDAVGFELYTSMLERTIKELKGEASEEAVETQLNLGLNIRIPPEYIAEENQRLRMYKRVAAVESVQQLADVRDELTDRYGEPPAAVRNLLEYAELKLASERVGVAGIDRRRDVVNIKFTEKAVVDPEKLAQFVAKERGAQFTPAGVLHFQLKSTRPEDVLTRLKELLAELASEQLALSG
ncbi:MAG: transcription-repair coupling factor [Candidatus Koribacter versatilis]|uniref:Transcription-repair-coupling factor n=1 Tax=Candidatus Korobacter versatilis TaxID=658062 RepID=A0A932A7B8_9BACT|nr:transcription-repair coupling factor [Candidatus Koribacter versatilis]